MPPCAENPVDTGARGGCRVLVLGGGAWQLDLIRRVRSLGHRAIVADISPDAPGRALADEFVEADTNDRPRMLQVARDHGVGLVLGDQADRVVPMQGYLNSALGLPGIDQATAQRFTNKLAMRDALVGRGIPMPRYAEVGTLEEAIYQTSVLGFPAILKPKQSWASMGVKKIDNLAQLRQAWPESLQQSRDGKLLVEEFINGIEITVEGYSLAGRYYPLAISEKEHYPHSPCVARKLAYPPRFTAEALSAIRLNAAWVVEGLGLVEGISHAEYRLRDGVPYLMEVAARGGGNRIASLIVPHVSGVDCYELLVRRLTGEALAMPARSHRAAILQFFTFRPGTVRQIHGLEQVRRQRLAEQIVLQFQPGDRLDYPTDDRRRVGFFITLGETRDEVEAQAARIESLVRVEYEKDPLSRNAA